MDIITKISFVLAAIFYAPVLIYSFILDFVGTILLKSSIKTFGGLGGYRAKCGLRFRKIAFRDFHESLLEMVAWATQLNKENIMKAIDAKKAYDFVVQDDRKKPPEEQTVFKCKFLDPYTAANLGDQIYSVSGVGSARKERLLTGTQQFEILKKCLVGWENMHSEDGASVPFDKEKVGDMIAMIPPKYRGEIADFIRGESEVTEGEG